MDRSFHDESWLEDERQRVLLCLSSRRDRTLLADRLSSADVEVVVPDDLDSLPSFDLCLVDPATYPRIAPALTRRRDRLGSVFLPVLLVLGQHDSEALAREVAGDIDDVLSVPTSPAVVEKRVGALLRTRRQSRRLALFRRAMDDAATGITIADADGDQELQYVNDAFVEMTGYDREEALGRNCRFLQGPDTDPEVVREIRGAIDAREPVAVELRNYRKDGSTFWNHLEIAPVYDRGSVSHFVGTQQDITERVEQDDALKRYERIVHAAGDPIYALDEELCFRLVNESTVALADRTESRLLGSHVTSLFGEQHGRRLERAIAHLTDTGGLETTFESTVSNADGRLRRYQTAIGILPAESFEGVVCVSRDITESREREARLSVLDRVLRHNLRNKMMVIQAQAEQVRWHSGQQSVVEAAEAIERNAEELLDLAETAREFERTVDPAEDDAVGPVDVGTHLCQAVAETGSEYGEATILADVPKPQWATAHDSFELAMTELLERAATAGEGTTVRVSLTVDRDGGDVQITVSHDGPGLDDVELHALNTGFESDLRHTQGLGLWFVRWMATNSGGRFTIENTGSGMRTELTLPLADPPEE